MIIYGHRSKLLDSVPLSDNCPECDARGSLVLYVFQRYAHLFWIPLFPMRKVLAAECGHCKAFMRRRELPGIIQEQGERIRSQTRTPVWTFSGLVLIAALVVAGVISGRRTVAQRTKFIEAPVVGDVYRWKPEAGAYSLMKVAALRGDTVFMRMSLYRSDRARGLRALERKGDSIYSGEPGVFLKGELKAMAERGEVISVERK